MLLCQPLQGRIPATALRIFSLGPQPRSAQGRTLSRRIVALPSPGSLPRSVQGRALSRRTVALPSPGSLLRSVQDRALSRRTNRGSPQG